ncbi:MAG: thiamine pyrophosphate-dependent enzyme, partial [Acetobacteraceae bacterium]
GDAAQATEALLSELANRPLRATASREQRLATVSAEKAAWEKELGSWTQETDDFSREVGAGGSALHPRQMLRALEQAMPKNAMVSTDIGNICSVANSYLRFEQPRSMLAAMSFGNCGYAFPVAIGAKAARPERPAVAYVGDGAFTMSFGEILTAVRENLPVTAVVFNNGQWGAEKKNQVDFYAHRFLGTNLKNPSFAAIARAMGAEGQVVGKLSEAGDALASACRAQRDGKTTILEMMVTQELGDPFRRDALSKPKRLLKKYAAYSVN